LAPTDRRSCRTDHGSIIGHLWTAPIDVRVDEGALKQALIPTLQEAGCEGMFETSRKDDPHKLVFFEIFSSSAAHKFHLEQDYMKRLFKALEGKLAGASIMTKLNAL
jgi:quinol monooxygenase YgiN